MLFQFKIFNIFSGKVLTNTLFFAIILKSTMIDAGMAQSVEHVIGNDEVTSSNLVTSSRKTPLQTKRGSVFLKERVEKQINA